MDNLGSRTASQRRQHVDYVYIERNEDIRCVTRTGPTFNNHTSHAARGRI